MGLIPFTRLWVQENDENLILIDLMVFPQFWISS